MRKIKLTKGKFALVDDEDYAHLNQFKWQALKGRKTYYAVRQKWVSEDNKSNCIYMHREILELTNPKEFCDHEDGDGLNNQRYNIRKCDDRLNKFNMSAHKGSTSKHKGVDFYKRVRKWRVRINKDKVTHYFGYFDSEKEAASIYNQAAIKLHGKFARLNQL